MDIIKRITVICFAAMVLAANIPLCASATDPVSAATMANALAQAITAYGASQGVSMTFDVASTDGIGEGVHELWNNFKEDIQDNNVPTYDSLAVTMWADIYTKIGNNVGININDTEMPYIDQFLNWLLSGPAELTKVDNQYYEWTLNQNNTVTPITVNVDTPFPYFNVGITYRFNYHENNQNRYYDVLISNASGRCYYFFTTNDYSLNIVSPDAFSGNMSLKYTNGTQYSSSNIYGAPFSAPYDNLYRYAEFLYANTDGVPYFPTRDAGMAAISSYLDDPYEDVVQIRPYIGDTTPQNVYIPDNEDVNYVPLPYVGGLDIPWDDSLFGDGSDTLTDAQSEAIAGVVDDAITDSLEKTLTLADTDNPDIPAPNEVYIPLLPVELPSFNFSLSGIWHYVVSWVQSLGAWLSLLFQTWAVLPSAITIPVYATAVIVIVLGVYKRFFM